jgi:hypothetical protein
MRVKRERGVTWWNPAAQTCPVFDSSSFVSMPMLPPKLASILLLAFSLFALVAALSQSLCSESTYVPIKLYSIYVCCMNIMLYSVPYYLRFHITAVRLVTYYPWIRGHYFTVMEGSATAHLQHRLGYGLVSLGFETQWEQEIFLFSKLFEPALGPTQPSIQSIPGFSFPGPTQLRQDAI